MFIDVGVGVVISNPPDESLLILFLLAPSPMNVRTTAANMTRDINTIAVL